MRQKVKFLVDYPVMPKEREKKPGAKPWEYRHKKGDEVFMSAENADALKDEKVVDLVKTDPPNRKPPLPARQALKDKIASGKKLTKEDIEAVKELL